MFIMVSFKDILINQAFKYNGFTYVKIDNSKAVFCSFITHRILNQYDIIEIIPEKEVSRIAVSCVVREKA